MKRIAALVCLFVPLTAAQESPYEQALRTGVVEFQRKRFGEALTAFSRARQIAPRDWRGHTWQSLTLIQQALAEKDPLRRRGLLEEAEAMTGPLVRQAGVLFQDPLRHYILGLVGSMRGDDDLAWEHFNKAFRADPRLFAPYAAPPLQGIDLRDNVRRGYARAGMEIGKRLIIEGKFDTADGFLQAARKELPEDDPGWGELRRHLAVASETLGRYEKAIEHLHGCIEFYSENRDLQLEFYGSIAQIYFKNQRLDEGGKVLAKIPADSSHPEILAARCTQRKIPALRDPESALMAEAIAYYDQVLDKYPPDDRSRLVDDYAELVLEKVGPADATKERALLERTMKLALEEQLRHPECPSFYFVLYRIHRLLGNKEKEIEYQNLWEQKKKEYETKARFDHRGRPRCARGGG